GVVADWHIAALLESVGDLPAVLAVHNPALEVAARLVLHLDQGGGVGIAEPVGAVGEFFGLGGAARIDDRPERRRLRRRCLGIEPGDVVFGQIGGDVAIAALIIPIPERGPVCTLKIVLGEVAPRDVMAAIIGRQEDSVALVV